MTLAFFLVLIFFCSLTTAERKFAIDNPDFKLKNFKFAGQIWQDTWGYGDPSSNLPMNHKGYDEILEKCDFNADKITMHQYGPMSTVIYYPNTPEFELFKGIDMIPENKHNYVRSSAFAKNLNFNDKEKITSEPMMMHTCRIPQDDGGAWHVQRVGPFYSTGGYDWWQLGWSDAGMLKEVLAKHPNGIDITATNLVPVSEDGTRLGHPPIHIHHIHFVTQQGVRPRNIMGALCVSSSGLSLHLDTMIKQKNCYNSSLFFEQHGDYECQEDEDGIDCLSVGDHNTRRINQVLDVEGDLNDVRPFNSPPLKWYYQVGVKWRPIQPEVRPVSMNTMMAPGNSGLPNQLSRVNTFPTPTNAPHFLWYTGEMWADGELHRNKLHAHNIIYESSAFIAASPADLGLDNPKFIPKVSFNPLDTGNLGFNTNDELAAYLLSNLQVTQDKFDEMCGPKGSAPSNQLCKKPRPQVICTSVFDMVEKPFGDPAVLFPFDRRPRGFCKPWTFKKGDPFTVLGFSRKLTRPPIPPYPERIPPTIPSHVSWQFWYYHTGWFHSYFSRTIYNQEGIFFEAHEQYDPFDVVGKIGATLIHGGMPVGTFTGKVIKTVSIAIFVSSLVYIVYCGVKPKKD